MGAHESAPVSEETAHDAGGDREGRVRNNLEGSARKAEVYRVDLHDEDACPRVELPQLGGSPRVQLDGDDGGPGGEKRLGEAARPGSEVQHEIARPDAGLGDEPGRKAPIEAVEPPPPRRVPAHGG